MWCLLRHGMERKPARDASAQGCGKLNSVANYPWRRSEGRSPACMQVSWSGIPNPTNADVVALYVQAPGTTVDTLSPLRFQWVNRSPGYEQGSGSITCALSPP